MNKDETHKEIENGVNLSIWFDDDTWVGCWSGMHQGLYSESDDVELSAKSQGQALKELEDEYHSYVQLMKEAKEESLLTTLDE